MKTFDEIYEITQKAEAELEVFKRTNKGYTKTKVGWLCGHVAELLSIAESAEPGAVIFRLAGYMELLARELLKLQMHHLEDRTSTWVLHRYAEVLTLRRLEDSILEVQAIMKKGLGI